MTPRSFGKKNHRCTSIAPPINACQTADCRSFVLAVPGLSFSVRQHHSPWHLRHQVPILRNEANSANCCEGRANVKRIRSPLVPTLTPQKLGGCLSILTAPLASRQHGNRKQGHSRAGCQDRAEDAQRIRSRRRQDAVPSSGPGAAIQLGHAGDGKDPRLKTRGSWDSLKVVRPR